MITNGLYIFLLLFLGTEHLAAHGSDICTKYYTSKATEKGAVLNLQELEAIKRRLPLDIYFNHPPESFESNIILGHEIDGQHWILNETLIHFENTGHFVKLLFNTSSPIITKLESASGILCEEGHEERSGITEHEEVGIPWHEGILRAVDTTTEFPKQPELPPACTVHTAEPEINREKLLQKTATWNTGRNYKIELSVLGSFVGYVIELIFTRPVTQIKASGLNVIQWDATHWAVTKEWTDPGCVKVIAVLIEVSFEEESDVESLFFNGKPLIGQGRSKAIFYNQNMRNALSEDCESYLPVLGAPWFGGEMGEKGKQMNFSAQVASSEGQIGVVVDFLFNSAIQSLTAWEITPKQISGNHWRLHNAGFFVPPKGNVSFPFIVRYFKHYHVAVVGIKLNGRVLCGLGTPVFLDNNEGPLLGESERPVTDAEFLAQTRKRVTEVRDISTSLLVTIVFLVFTTAVGVASVAYLLLGKMSAVRRNRKHLCDFPAREVPQQLDRDDSTQYEDTVISHM